MVRIVSIEGPIGAGKSSVFEALKESLKYSETVFLPEPVDTWVQAGLLEALYDGSLPPIAFQLAALATRFGPLLKAVGNGAQTIVSERTPWSDESVFSKSLLPAHPHVHRAAYDVAYQALMATLPPVELHTLYLRCDAKTSMVRMATRGRAAECVRDAEERLQYLQRLYERHEAYFNETAFVSKQQIDATLSPKQVANEALAFVQGALFA